jgi:hypothetical protein
MPLIPALFSVFWVSVLAWCLMVAGLERHLAARHPAVHAGLGRTGNGNLPLGRELAMLRFLCAARDRGLGDSGLGRRCTALRLLLVGYTVFFLVTPTLLSR